MVSSCTCVKLLLGGATKQCMALLALVCCLHIRSKNGYYVEKCSANI